MSTTIAMEDGVSTTTAFPLLHVLFVDDDVNIRKTLTACLETDAHKVIAVSNKDDALAEASRKHFDVAFVDLHLENTSGSDLVPELLAQSPWIEVIIITAHGSVNSAVDMMKRGASDYITKPLSPVQIRQLIDNVNAQKAARSATLRTSDALISSSLESNNATMQRVIGLARQVANTETTILICGESGTGKGVLAQAIHDLSGRAARPFATVSCPALSPQLLESELFGHVRGAFTGAVRDNPGRITTTNGGTLFLDEIGDLPLELQPKLLRFVQDRQYESVGDASTRLADVRLIVATNVDLDEAVRAGRFREDLFYRIKVIQIDVPPLRQRPEDILPLAGRFLHELRHDAGVNGFTDEARSAIQDYNWPGNVREVRNVIERALILCRSGPIGLQHLPGNFLPNASPSPELGDPIPMEKLEEVHIRRVLARSKSLDDAARVLGMDRATLWRRKKYGI